MNTEKTDFTQGSILKKLSLFMLPVLGALILQAAYPLSDAAFIMTEIKSGISRKEFKSVMIF